MKEMILAPLMEPLDQKEINRYNSRIFKRYDKNKPLW